MDHKYQTEILPVSAASIDRAASLLKAGEVVAFPTETVYGLGADAFNEKALQKIFAAKGRPSDNPLIAHISSIEMLKMLTDAVDVMETIDAADAILSRIKLLCSAFWPGPLTIIVKRKKGVPGLLSAGLPTVAVRMPSHPAARALIEALGKPVAAPSANRSGKPSPTTARHVLDDLSGRIPLILDGGPCELGLESTVIDLTGKIPTVLRPGGVTVDMLKRVLPDVAVDGTVLRPLDASAEAKSPGMKHRHYAPDARVVVVEGTQEAVGRKCFELYDQAEKMGQKPVILDALGLSGLASESDTLYDRDLLHHEKDAREQIVVVSGRDVLPLGKNARDMAARLYDTLRALDAAGVDLIIAQAVDTEGMGLALMNRLLRAADFERVRV